MKTDCMVGLVVDRQRLASRQGGIAANPGYDHQEPFAQTYLAMEGAPVPLRISKAFSAAVLTSPVTIGSTETFIGVPQPRRVIALNPAPGHVYTWYPPEWNLPQDERERVLQLAKAMEPHLTNATILAQKQDAGVDLDPSLGSGPSFQGHMLVDFGSVLREGIDGFAARLFKAESKPDRKPEQIVFHQCMRQMIETWRQLLERQAQAAESLAAISADARAEELRSIAHTCRAVIGPAPKTLHQAVQLYWTTFLLDGPDDAGRLDQLLWPFLQSDLEAGHIDPETAVDLLTDLYFKLESVTAWGLVLGGTDAAGQDVCNPLTTFFLELAEVFPQTHPAISLRVHQGTPPEVLAQAIRTLHSGAGMPALINDDAIVPALMRSGVAQADAWDYGVGGCIEYQVAGKGCVGGEDGQINLAKCLELALSDGVCQLTGKRLGPSTGDAAAFTCFEDVERAYTSQVEWAAERILAGCTIGQKVKSQQLTKPMRSLLTADCLERGLDCEGGGARYGHGQILTMGLIVVADSLAVLRHLVFGDASVALGELLAALKANWQGHESLHQRITTRAPRCGNGDARADSLAAWAADHLWNFIGQYQTNRGGYYTGLVVYHNRAWKFGNCTAASADGRRAGEVLEDSIGPYQGRDRLGPTAMLQSAAAIPQHLAGGGVILNLRLDPATLATDTGQAAAAALVRGYFSIGGQHMQVNVVATADLEAAMQDPKSWGHLIVRVGGYSARFTALDPIQQRSIIARTIHLT